MARAIVLTLNLVLLSSCKSEGHLRYELDYDQMILLDAEALAEGGIGEAYQSLLPKLRRFVSQPVEIEEVIEDNASRYAVRYRDREYNIYSPGFEDREGQSWGRATHALFSIVNDELVNSEHLFYAINSGNDLGGMFLTPEECEAAQKSLSGKTDWPYLPTLDHPWYGQHHD
jgi:hypothetical protein